MRSVCIYLRNDYELSCNSFLSLPLPLSPDFFFLLAFFFCFFASFCFRLNHYCSILLSFVSALLIYFHSTTMNG